MINGHGEKEKVVNGFRSEGNPEERINGQEANGGGGLVDRNVSGGDDGGGGGGGETEVKENGAAAPQPPVVAFTQVKRKRTVSRQGSFFSIIRHLREGSW